MKKLLLFLCFTMLSAGLTRAQCVYTCSNYAVSPITYSTFPNGTLNVVPSFTNTYLGTFADDGSTGPIPIGFNFDFYCNTYTNIHICSNGFIMLDYMAFPWPTQYVHPTQNIPDPTLVNGMIAFDMTDMDPSTTGTITYTTVGVAPNRMFIVSFNGVPCFSTPSDLNTGQIVLYETSNIIEIHTASAHADINQGTLGATQGIENTTGTAAATPPGRNANANWGASANNTAYRFAPYMPTPPTILMGNTSVCSGIQSSYSVTPNTGAQSYSWTAPAGWVGTSTTNILNSTVGNSGTVEVAVVYTCGISTPTTIYVNAIPAPAVSMTADNMIICSGQLVSITPTGAVTYTLEPGTLSGTSVFLVSPGVDATYTLYGTDASGCNSVNNPNIMITVNLTPTVTVNSGSVCPGQTFTISPAGADFYTYSSGFPLITQTVPGQYSYSVVGTATNGCAAAPAISTLLVFPNPTITVTANNNRTTICQSERTILTAQGADTYSWTNGGGASTFTVLPGNNFITTYSVVGTNTAGGCSKIGSISIITDPCTGIDELSRSSNAFVRAYPNPSNGMVSVSMAKAATVEMYDLQGRLVHKQIMEEGTHTFNMEGLNAGQYLLRAISDTATQSIVLIKE